MKQTNTKIIITNSGTIPAEVDPETGLDINPHIPSYISKAPWYVDKGHASLSHQRVNDETSASGSAGYDTNFYARGTRAGPAATKYRKGACENCGALTHKTRDCLERPRKVRDYIFLIIRVYQVIIN